MLMTQNISSAQAGISYKPSLTTFSKCFKNGGIKSFHQVMDADHPCRKISC